MSAPAEDVVGGAMRDFDAFMLLRWVWEAGAPLFRTLGLLAVVLAAGVAVGLGVFVVGRARRELREGREPWNVDWSPHCATDELGEWLDPTEDFVGSELVPPAGDET